MSRTRLMIITGVRLYAEGLRRDLGGDPRFEVVAVAAGADDALCALRAGSLDPDLVLMDLKTSDFHRLQAELNGARIVVLGVRELEDDVVAWAEEGIDGFVTPQASLEELADVLAFAARGETLCSPRMTAALLRRVGSSRRASEGRRDTPPPLTVREREILELLQRGLSNKAIARHLQIEVPTVKNHVHHVLEKLDARTRAEAAARAREALEPGLGP